MRFKFASVNLHSVSFKNNLNSLLLIFCVSIGMAFLSLRIDTYVLFQPITAIRFL